MQKYNIDVSNVVRHYDVSGKLCPNVDGWISEISTDTEWLKFKDKIV